MNSFVHKLIEEAKQNFLKGGEDSLIIYGVKVKDNYICTGVNISEIPTPTLRRQAIEAVSRKFAEKKEPVDFFCSVINGFGSTFKKEDYDKGSIVRPSLDPDRQEYLMFELLDQDGHRFFQMFGIDRSQEGMNMFFDSTDKRMFNQIGDSQKNLVESEGWIVKKDQNDKNLVEMPDSLASLARMSYKFGLLIPTLTKNNPTKGKKSSDAKK